MDRHEQFRKTTLFLKSTFEKALLLKEKQAQSLEQTLGLDNMKTIKALVGLAHIYEFKGEKIRAAEIRHRVLPGAIKHLGLEDSNIIQMITYQSRYYIRHDRLEDELNLMQIACQKAVEELGPHSPRTYGMQTRLLVALLRNRHFEDVVHLGETILESLKHEVTPDEMVVAIVKQRTAEAKQLIGLGNKRDYEAKFGEAAQLLEEALASSQARAELGRKWTLAETRDLRNCYVKLKRGPQAIEKAKAALKLSIAVYGMYSEEESEDAEALLKAYLGVNSFRESFNVGLIRCEHALRPGKDAVPRLLRVVLEQLQLFKMIDPTKEDYRKMSKLLLAVFGPDEKWQRASEYLELGADFEKALREMQQEGSKQDIENSEQMTLDVDALKALLKDDNPEAVLFQVTKDEMNKPEWKNFNDISKRLEQLGVSSRAVGARQTTMPQELKDDSDRKEEVDAHDLCYQLLKQQPRPNLEDKPLLVSDDDPNAFLGEDIEVLKAKIENGDAEIVTADMSYDKLDALLDELCARKAEERFMISTRCWKGPSCFEDWPRITFEDLLADKLASDEFLEKGITWHRIPQSDDEIVI